MGRYFFRRLIAMPLTLVGVMFILTLIFYGLGWDPCLSRLGRYADSESLQSCRIQMNLNRSLLEQFFIYVWEVFSFDFGRDLQGRLILGRIRSGIGPSLSLAMPAFVLSFVFSLLFALISVRFRGKLTDRWIRFACIAGMSISELGYILLGQYVLAFQWNLFPVSGYASFGESAVPYLILPILIWIVVSLGGDVRYFRTVLVEEINQDYVRTARSKGLGDGRVYWLHILSNSLVPILSYLVMQIPFLMLGSFLLERFFAIPGLGHMMIEAIYRADFQVIKVMTAWGAILFMLGDLLSDFAFRWADPRIQLR